MEPLPDAYTLLVEAVARSNRLVIYEAETEKLADAVGSKAGVEKEEEGA